MNQELIIKVTIDKKIYEKVCTCINNVLTTLPQTNLKIKYKKIINEKNYTYTQEMQNESIKLKAAKKIIAKNKKIDFQRFLLKTIISTNNEIEFIIFICKQLNNYKPNTVKKINKLTLVS